MSDDRADSFGAVIAIRRKSLGLSQDQVAAEIRRGNGASLSVTELNSLEHDREDPRDRTLVESLAAALKLEADDLWKLAASYSDAFAQSRTINENFRSSMLAYRRSLEPR